MQQTIQEQAWIKIGKLRDLFYCIFFFCMPFTQAMTFNIGFPLKFSELMLFLLSFLYIFFNKRVLLPRPLLYLLALLLITVTLSVGYNLIREFPYPLREFATRFGYKGDSLSRYVYFLLALMAFFISIDIFLDNRVRYINAWLYGALLAAAYCWYLSVFSFLRLPVVLLPGMIHPPQAVAAFGREIIRCGTFTEGNMMGLYLILSAAMAFYIRRARIAIILLASTLPTFSTLSILSVFVFLVLFLQRLIFRRKYLGYILPALAGMSLLIYFFSRTSLYKTYVYNKLFASTQKVDDVSAYSKTDRLFSIKDAWHMGAANPVLGVGLSNYSRHYGRFMDTNGFDTAFVKTLTRPGDRVIPNNIYLELWSESGGVALALFLLLIGLLVVYSLRDRTKALFPAMVCMLICFIAYPSFIMLYIWSFMALVVANRILVSHPQTSGT